MRHSLGAVVGALVLSACGPETAAPPASLARPGPPIASSAPALPTEPAPLGPLPTDVHPTRESLALDLDPARDRFGGAAEIALRLDRPRDTLWLHGRGLAVTSAVVALATGETLQGRWDEVDPTGVARVTLPRAIGPGAATLRLTYDAPYDPQLVGVYRVKTSAGPAVFSKLEAIYARRAFPCFDEPSFKIPFDVALTVPAGDTAIGNMPIADDAPAPGGKRRVRFETTPPLSTYLVAFAVGPFASRASSLPPNALRPKALPVVAVAMRGREGETAFALAEAPAFLAEQERYFGVAFPYPKLDLLAVPDFQTGAMENAGAITFRDSLFLIDERSASQGQRISVLGVLAHEMAHQWFGDLVTMPWWDDLWLNEGFASFLGTKTMRAVRPELEAELAEVQSASDVMAVDGLPSARRVRQPIASTHDITNAFDGITYQKGEAFLTMLEHFLGEETFRRGVHAFLVEHATKNATTDDLVRALSAAAGRDLGPLAASFLDQPGVPLVAVSARCEHGKGSLALEQSRWRPAGSKLAAEATWTVPVCVRVGIGARVEERCTLLASRTGAMDLPACADWVMPNAQASGYYRFTLAPADLARLRDRGTKRLSTAERMALAQSLEAAFRSGSLPGADVLRALEPLARDAHGAVARVPLDLYRDVDSFIVGDAQDAAFRRYVARLYAPAVASLGWKTSPSETASRRLFRTALLVFLALRIEDRPTLDEAARLGRRYLGLDGDGTIHPEVVDPDLNGLVLAAAVRASRKGDAAVFDALLAALVRSDDAQTRRRLLVALASTRDPALVTRALDLALDPRLHQNERLATLGTFLQSVATRDAAWAWLEGHFDALTPLLPDRYAGYLPSLPNVCDEARARDLRAFFTPRVEKMTGGPRNLAQALEAAEQCAAGASTQGDSVRAFVKGQR